MARKNYNGVSYDTEIDYKKQYDTAVANGDYVLAAAIEKVRNAKIDGEGLSYAKTNNYSSFASPATSASPAVSKTSYGEAAEGLLGRAGAMNFHYNAEKDPLYKQIKKNYADTAGDVIENTMGIYAGMTGGMPSSYAASAAAQAGAQHLQKADDMIPELYRLAYGKFADDKADLYKQYGIMQGLEEQAYNREWEQKKWDYGVAQDAEANELAKTKAENDKIVSLAEIEAEVLKEGNDMQKQYFDQAMELVERGTPPSDEIMALAGLGMTGQQFYDNYVSESNRVLAEKNKYSSKGTSEPKEAELKKPTDTMFSAIDKIIEDGGDVSEIERKISQYDSEKYDLAQLYDYAENYYDVDFDANMAKNYADKLNKSIQKKYGDKYFALIDKGDGTYKAGNAGVEYIIKNVFEDTSLTQEEAETLLFDYFGITEKQIENVLNDTHYSR